jgi:hypothetical protein
MDDSLLMGTNIIRNLERFRLRQSQEDRKNNKRKENKKSGKEILILKQRS